MVILPSDYKEKYLCVNENGMTAVIYADKDFEYAYKIYNREFDYSEEKMNELYKLTNPYVLSPKDIISLEDNQTEIVGYKMLYDKGKALNRLYGVTLTKLIEASSDINPTLEDISSYHLLILDPNVANILFSDSYKFVDVYSFGLYKQFSEKNIYLKNLLKVNQTVLSGLIGLNYKEVILKYLELNPKYNRIISKIKNTDPNYVAIILSLLQDSLQEDNLDVVKKKVLTQNKKPNT